MAPRLPGWRGSQFRGRLRNAAGHQPVIRLAAGRKNRNVSGRPTRVRLPLCLNECLGLVSRPETGQGLERFDPWCLNLGALLRLALRGVQLALLPLTRLFEMLMATKITQDPRLLALLLETAKGALERFALFHTNSSHEKRYTPSTLDSAPWAPEQGQSFPALRYFDLISLRGDQGTCPCRRILRNKLAAQPPRVKRSFRSSRPDPPKLAQLPSTQGPTGARTGAPWRPSPPVTCLAPTR